MATYNIPVMNGTGLDEVLVSVVHAVPAFTPAMLLFVWFVVFITGFQKQKIDSGVADAPLWATISGVITTLVALLLSRVEGLIGGTYLAITISITILCAIWLFASQDRI